MGLTSTWFHYVPLIIVDVVRCYYVLRVTHNAGVIVYNFIMATGLLDGIAYLGLFIAISDRRYICIIVLMQFLVNMCIEISQVNVIFRKEGFQLW